MTSSPLSGKWPCSPSRPTPFLQKYTATAILPWLFIFDIMKIIAPLLAFLVLFSCQKKTEHHHNHQSESDITQLPLYREVMDIHDEGMYKMDSMYLMKRKLQTQLEMPGLSSDTREKLQLKIARLDSADQGMRVWMRTFDPPKDSSEWKSYLESERIKVIKVRDDILRALKTAQ
jgi:hypothetical protein